MAASEIEARIGDYVDRRADDMIAFLKTVVSTRSLWGDVKELATTFRLGAGYRDWLLVLRLRVAALLLSAPSATVSDVAECVGYGSPIALARAFRDAGLPSPSVIQDAMLEPT